MTFACHFVVDKCHSAKEQGSVTAQLELWELVELIWNLCELLYIDTAPGGIVLSQLLDWLRLHFVEADHMARESLQHDTPHKHPQYWNAVSWVACKLVEINDVCSCSRMHSTAI